MYRSVKKPFSTNDVQMIHLDAPMVIGYYDEDLLVGTEKVFLLSPPRPAPPGCLYPIKNSPHNDNKYF